MVARYAHRACDRQDSGHIPGTNPSAGSSTAYGPSAGSLNITIGYSQLCGDPALKAEPVISPKIPS